MNIHHPHTKYATCSACHGRFPCSWQNYFPDNGWVLPFDTFGYYGGFSDAVEVLMGGTLSRQWILCHGCVVKLLDTFPRLAESFGGAHHSCDDEVPCCQFAWQVADVSGDDGGKRTVRTRTSFPDGVWHDDPAPDTLPPMDNWNDLTLDELTDICDENYYNLASTGEMAFSAFMDDAMRGAFTEYHGLSTELTAMLAYSFAKRMMVVWDTPAIKPTSPR